MSREPFFTPTDKDMRCNNKTVYVADIPSRSLYGSPCKSPCGSPYKSLNGCYKPNPCYDLSALSDGWWVWMLLGFITNLLLARTFIHLGCYVIGLIIVEIIILGISIRNWTLLTRLGVIAASIIGFLWGRIFMCGELMKEGEFV